jgi:glyoxylase-like metal-dependent hydrolase (beta-lactamase superfamily II)
MKIKTFVTGLLQTNTYLVYGEGGGAAVLIDPAHDVKAADRIKLFLAESKISLSAVLLTHGHFDHAGGCCLFAGEDEREGQSKLPVYIGAEDAALAQKASAQGALFGIRCPDVYPNRFIQCSMCNAQCAMEEGGLNQRAMLNAQRATEVGGLNEDGAARLLCPTTKHPTATEHCALSIAHCNNDATAIAHCALSTENCRLQGNTIAINGFAIRALHTPGHTRGGVCYIIGDNLFSGDTLFRFSIGRTDFEGGSKTEMKESLRLLSLLETDYAVYPGHGEATTLSFEKKSNIYMKGQW